MTIGLVCPYDIRRAGGVQDCIRHLQNTLAKHGHTVYIIAPKIEPQPGALDLPPNTILLGTATRVKALSTTGEVSVDIKTKDIDSMFEKYNFEVLNFHEPWVPMLSRQVLVRSNAINIGTFHARLPDGIAAQTFKTVIQPYTKKVLTYLDGLVAVSDAAAEHVRSLTAQKVTIIPNGIDLDKYQPQNSKLKTQGSKTILFVGRLEKRKGAKYLIRAFAKLQKSDSTIQLLIAGDGPERSELERWAKYRQISNVKFLGRISEAEKIKLMHSASLACYPATHGESFGIVLIEAMAAGLVIVAGNNPGYKCVLRGNGSISLVNPKDITAFADKLHAMLNDTELRNQWLNWAASDIKQYDFDLVASAYEKYFKSYVGG